MVPEIMELVSSYHYLANNLCHTGSTHITAEALLPKVSCKKFDIQQLYC